MELAPRPTAGGKGTQQFPPTGLRGAVDLGALASARDASRQAHERQAQRAAGGAPTVIIDVTSASFQVDVIDASFQVPVVVDLWATWCQPCKQLSPILEKLAAEGGGDWILAKVDIDAEKEIAAAFQVQSVPTVMAILKGQPIPMFAGALPESQVRQVIAELLKVAKQHGVDGRVGGEPSAAEAESEPPPPTLDTKYEAAYDAFERGDWAGAASAFQHVLDNDPGDLEAAAGVIRCGVMSRTHGVEPEVAITRSDAHPGDVGAALTAADCEIISGQPSAAFARLIAAVRLTTGVERDRVRSHLLDLFALVGSDDPSVGHARAALASALF